MKKTLYTTSHGNSTVNFALDTQREMDHQAALKGFRKGSQEASILPRMAQVDRLEDSRKVRQQLFKHESRDQHDSWKTFIPMAWKVSDVDIGYILPTAKMILKKGGLDLTKANDVPMNFYDDKIPKPLPTAVLDDASMNAGHYLIKKYLVNNNLMGTSSVHLPKNTDLEGPKLLCSKVQKSSVTVNRMTCKEKTSAEQSVHEKIEVTRQAHLKKEQKKI